MDVCDSCIEISKLSTSQHDGKKPFRIQCSACGAWWKACWFSPTLWLPHERRWTWRIIRDPFVGIYVPIECQQRGCREHARHKLKGQRGAKGKWKCDRHAGVCIVA